MMHPPPASGRRTPRFVIGLLLTVFGASGLLSGALLTFLGAFGAHGYIGWAALATLLSVLALGAGIPLAISGARVRPRPGPPVSAIVIAASAIVLSVLMLPLPIVALCVWPTILIGAVIAWRGQRVNGWTPPVVVAIALVALSIAAAITVHVLQAQQRDAVADALKTSVVQFDVTSDAGTALSIEATHEAAGDRGPTVVADVEDQSLPWTIDHRIEPPGDYTAWTLSATAIIDASTITCRITVDGVVIAEETVEGVNDGFAGPHVECRGEGRDLSD